MSSRDRLKYLTSDKGIVICVYCDGWILPGGHFTRDRELVIRVMEKLAKTNVQSKREYVLPLKEIKKHGN